MSSRVCRDRFAGIIGNFLEHYDNALFGLLSPFIAPLFFEGNDPITALVLTYSMLPLGLITRPFGSLVFGWIGDHFGRRQALFLSLTGMAIITVMMGYLPLYKDIGPWSPFLLALCRMFQGFFAAGEVSGGAIFVLERTPSTERSLVSSYYDACSIGGILLASGIVTLMSSQSLIEEGWRYLFWTGGATAIIGIIVRLQSVKTPETIEAPRVREESFFSRASCETIRRRKIALLRSFATAMSCLPTWAGRRGRCPGDYVALAKSPQNHRFCRGGEFCNCLSILKLYGGPFFGIFFAAGFSYTTYSFAFTLMNGFIPLVTLLSKTQVMQVNTILLVYDMLCLPVMGYLASRLGKEKVMITGAVCSALFALPMFHLLESASLGTVIAVRFAIISFGVAFSAPYYAWAIERVPPRHRYLILSLGGAFGSQCIGMPTPAICLWLYQTFGWSWTPGLYLQATSIMAGLSVFLFLRKEKILALRPK